ncbi:MULTISPECIES: lysine/arginine/ornithine ABC transporter substrate-binding protein [Pseudomonas]|uniref:ABC transporter substrate-binding protein n=1 Tax=Pseudomonas putida TaxID=303 RepID=A0A2S3WDR8_PSEPU|nr:lysine/arginine/ornithine ABC transporter substrate-binding protein [Pseudomonas putida]EKT4458097.1 transporter substrate-binding domain-containing protein [Pseudomonas putida]EKT4515109.1 transporter substrate-binding domain-containing protein [Pseudomonas putida]POF88808.1 ABC transporter substrate-binding protein [Pseudomonas putida]
MRFKSLTLSAIILSGVCASFANAEDSQVIRIATEGAYAPWNFVKPGGQLDGFEIELARDLCDRMKAKCEITAHDWEGLIPSLNSGKIDAIMAGMSITPKRQEVIGFSRPYAAPLNGFLVLDSSSLSRLPGESKSIDLDKDEPGAEAVIKEMAPLLKGKVIGVQGSTTASGFAEKYLSKVVEVREYKTVDSHNMDLMSGRIDAVLANAVVLKLATQDASMKGADMAGPVFSGGVFGPGIGIGLRKSDADLKAKFDEAITAAVKDGTVKQLSEKWLKFDVTPLE